MSFKQEFLRDRKVTSVLHLGAYNGSELPIYANIGVKKIVWVEANPELYKELDYNVRESKSRYPDIENIMFNSLISDKDDIETDFHLYYWQDNRGMSSIYEKTSGSAGTMDAETNKKLYYKGTLKLNSVTVDTLLSRNDIDYDFDLLNMDLQGAELLASKGATKVLEKVKYINTEMTLFAHDYEGAAYYSELYEYLKQFGFVDIGQDLCGDGSWGDAFLVREGL